MKASCFALLGGTACAALGVYSMVGTDSKEGPALSNSCRPIDEAAHQAGRTIDALEVTKQRPPCDCSTEVMGMKRLEVELEKLNANLQAEVRELQAQLKHAVIDSEADDVVDLSSSTLDEMARRCELRWDNPPTEGKSTSLSDNVMAFVGVDLERTEIDALAGMIGDHGAQLNSQLEKIYAEVTGDPPDETIAPGEIVDAINSSVPVDVLKDVFHYFAQRRAGHPVPDDFIKTSPIARLYEMLTTSGDQLEERMAAQFGPELAHKIRRMNGGWGSKTKSSFGCPQS